ncbi:M15 family metallopeptidase [Agromyces sp. Leaf222]|uniref:M15 family metallopeptidase n=1 Tax=Agromyces sp. Leaf222 TaxID=1735688 RepID=UPI0006F6959E|nr:M15 family metallopeptidase [Agromyces sp. Leaf222]KQM83784.1 peptidase M15 [Agromyces sp. Leaf222]
MTSTHRTRTSTRGIRSAMLLVLALAAALLVAVFAGSLAGRSSAASSPRAPGDAPARLQPPAAGADGGLDGDGRVDDGVTVFDDEEPAVGNLDPELLDAVRLAATEAAGDGVSFIVNSGWRSPEYQEQLLRDAVAEYGSAEEAAKWVATAGTSPHVRGDAIDLGPWDATAWLSEHGAAYGLCQVYANESWHFELRPDAASDGCPAMYADPTGDPRMQG